MRRQWPVVLALAVATAVLGLLFQTAGGMRVLPALLIWAPIGLAAGFVAASVRELSRNTVTSLSSLGRHRGFAVLGAAPELTPRTLRELPPDNRTPVGCLTFLPASPFATAFRDLQEAISGATVVAFIGSVPGEGATTSALCAAISATQQGRNVIVLDCDLRRRSLTRALEVEPDAGVLEACAHPENWRDYALEEDETGLPFIPAARSGNAWRSLIGTPGFSLLIDRLRDEFDLVILDCPPALSSAEGPVIARTADRCVVVTAWDETRLAAVRDTMRQLRARARETTGIYVNRVPPGYRFGRLRPD